jgi:translation initiation factor IF-2
MSTPTKTPRLLAAAKEFNIGKGTLIEFLTNKTFAVTDSPAFKLTEEMYDALTAEFAQDKAAKRRSDEIALPKSLGERKKDVEQPVKKADAVPPPAAKVEPEVKPAVTQPTPPVVSEEEPKAAPPVQEEAPPKEEKPTPAPKEEPVAPPKVEEPVAKPEPVEVPAPVVIKQEEPKEIPAPEPVVEPKAPKAEEVVEKAPVAVETPQSQPVAEDVPEQEEEGHIEMKAPKLGGPNILGKINLADLNQSTRPKKGVVTKKAAPPVREVPAAAKPSQPKEQPKKKEIRRDDVRKEEPVQKATPKPVETPKPQPPVVPTPKVEKPATPEEETKLEHIEMKAPQLAGPKIIGRIELPVNEPSKSSSANERRNRKRIPVQKKPETNNRQGQGQGGQQQGGAQQGGQGGGFNRGAGQGGQNRGTGQGGQNRGGAGQGGGFNRGAGQGGQNRGTGNRPGDNRGNQPQEVDSKEIQRKIQETQARLAGGRGGGKNQKAKYRRDKRELMAEKRAAAENNENGSVIQVTEFISVSELASLMDVSFAEVISKCMNLGIMVSINQRLDAEVIELVAAEFGFEASFINLEQEADIETEEEIDDADSQVARAPIVTIMGHVDHGKTSLLDYIRSANVVAGESGGITQHIGAYQVKTANDKRITFLDTPGHEAFTAMRARGAKVADIAVIVIAADDAIMPQTKEAISHAQAAGLPMIFALNKIDKDGANPEKIREQLSGMNILVEEWGGKFQSQEISAKKGLNVDLLLEKIGLESELLELKANPDRTASGSVIEASLDKGRGYVATILVQNGTLKQGDMIACGQHFGRVKAMLNERGQRVTSAGPSSPVQVLGLNGAPQAGEKFKMYEDENEAKEIATHRAQILREQGIRARKHLTLEEIGRRLALGNFKELPVIIKGDFDGSVEALSDSLQKLSTEEVAVNVVMKGVGAVTESDVNLATASDAIIIGFQVRPTAQASRLAEQENIEIRTYSIIYDAINEIKSAMEGLLEPSKETKILANVEVREVYKISGVGTIAGCYVLDGKIFRNSRINLIRDGKVVMTGELASLKRFKDDVKEVNFGYECGMSIKNYSDMRVGDIIEAFEEIEVKRTL